MLVLVESELYVHEINMSSLHVTVDVYAVVYPVGTRSFPDFEKYTGVNLNFIVDSIWRSKSLVKSLKPICLSTIATRRTNNKIDKAFCWIKLKVYLE